MGVKCEIDIITPSCEVFLPGSPVTGTTRYEVDEKTALDSVIISLKGIGRLSISKRACGNEEKTQYYREENYLNFKTIVKLDEDDGLPILNGREYETQFNFKLPENIPTSLNYFNEQCGNTVTCVISYCVQVTFQLSGHIKSAKKFKKEINIISAGIKPTLPVQPTTYKEVKKLFRFMQKEPSLVIIKATIENSVLRPGDKVKIAYEVTNNTNTTIKSIETKIVEWYTFYPYKRYAVEMNHDLKDLDSKTGNIKGGETLNSVFEVVVPCDFRSMGHSKLVTKDYSFLLTVELPVPHRNATLRVPIQVCDSLRFQDLSIENQPIEVAGTSYDPPPPYWESVDEKKMDAHQEEPEQKIYYNAAEEHLNERAVNEIGP